MTATADSGSPLPGGGGRRGLFLVLEGVEGAGKTTQVARLCGWLRERAVEVVTAREPGGTPVGEAVREVLLDRGSLRIGAESELLLMLAARAAFVREIVKPTLERGAVMLADRFEYSTLAYQGFGRGLDLDEIRRLNAFATGGLGPDLVIILDLPAAEGRARQRESGKSEDRIESSGDSFLERVAKGYRNLAERDPHAILIEAMASPDAVHAAIREALTDRFPELSGFDRGSNSPNLPLP